MNDNLKEILYIFIFAIYLRDLFSQTDRSVTVKNVEPLRAYQTFVDISLLST